MAGNTKRRVLLLLLLLQTRRRARRVKPPLPTSVDPPVGQEAGGVVLHQGPQVVRGADQLLDVAAVAVEVLRKNVPVKKKKMHMTDSAS